MKYKPCSRRRWAGCTQRNSGPRQIDPHVVRSLRPSSRSQYATALSALPGLRPAEPGEFSRRAFLAGKIDLTQAEAIAELISARSDAELKIANSNLKGSLSQSIKSLQSSILRLQALLEASLDFPEDEIEEESQSSLIEEMNSISNRMESFIKNSQKKKFKLI